MPDLDGMPPPPTSNSSTIANEPLQRPRHPSELADKSDLSNEELKIRCCDVFRGIEMNEDDVITNAGNCFRGALDDGIMIAETGHEAFVTQESVVYDEEEADSVHMWLRTESDSRTLPEEHKTFLVQLDSGERLLMCGTPDIYSNIAMGNTEAVVREFDPDYVPPSSSVDLHDAKIFYGDDVLWLAEPLKVVSQFHTQLKDEISCSMSNIRFPLNGETMKGFAVTQREGWWHGESDFTDRFVVMPGWGCPIDIFTIERRV